MIYDRHIDKTEEELCKLKDVYGQSNLHRFLDGLLAGQINNEEKVIKFTNYIRESDGLTQLENSRLKRLRDEGFIDKFATNYNKCYSTTHMLMNKMNSSISRGIKTLDKFCEKKRSRRGTKSKRKVINNSKIGKGAYTQSYWGLEVYKDSVRVLYNELNSYKEHLSEGIELCLYITRQVAYIRNHPKVAHEKHNMNRQKVLMNNRSIIKRFIDMNAEMENELMSKVEKWKQDKKTVEEISAMLYHTIDENEYNDWIISEEVMAARRDGITNQERALWGNNKEQVMRCKVAYAHIDELNPKGQKDHIGGCFLALLYKWSKTLPTHGLDYWYTYFVDFYKASGGVFTPVKTGAIKMELSKMARGKVEADEIKKFNDNIERLIKKYINVTSFKKENEKIVVNF